MKKIFLTIFFLALSVSANAQFWYAGGGGGGGGGDMLAATYDPAAGERQVAFSDELIANGTIVGQMLYWDGLAWTPATGVLWDETNSIMGITGTVGPQQRWYYDALHYNDLFVDAAGNLRISPTGPNTFLGGSSGQFNTGANSSGVGSQSLRFNGGANSSGVGIQALRYNIGAGSSGVGTQSLGYNVGPFSSGVGYYCLRLNIGQYSGGLGAYVLQYNQSEFASAFGHQAWSAFIDNTAGNKTFSFSDISVATNRITVTAHGFGSATEYKNVRYTEGTSPIPDLINGEVYQIRIIDANTLGFNESGRGINITDAGTGTGHILTPQFEFDNTISIGNNSEPIRARSIYLGGPDHDFVELDENTIVNGNVTINGTLDAETVNITSVITPAALGAQQDNWAPAGYSTCQIIRASTTGANVNISGIVAIPSRMLFIMNVGSPGNIVMLNESLSSIAENRFSLNTNITLQANECYQFWYDTISQRWRCLGRYS